MGWDSARGGAEVNRNLRLRGTGRMAEKPKLSFCPSIACGVRVSVVVRGVVDTL